MAMNVIAASGSILKFMNCVRDPVAEASGYFGMSE
jgi:hypothetical protein